MCVRIRSAMAPQSDTIFIRMWIPNERMREPARERAKCSRSFILSLSYLRTLSRSRSLVRCVSMHACICVGMGLSHSSAHIRAHNLTQVSHHAKTTSTHIQRCPARALQFSVRRSGCMRYSNHHTSCSPLTHTRTQCSLLLSSYLSLFVFFFSLVWVRRSRVERLKCAIIETLLAYFVILPTNSHRIFFMAAAAQIH